MGGGTTCACLVGAGAMKEMQSLARDAICGRGIETLASPPLPASNLCQTHPDSSGLGDLGQTDPVGAGNRGKTREGSKEGNGKQRGLKDIGVVKFSKYWLLPID